MNLEQMQARLGEIDTKLAEFDNLTEDQTTSEVQAEIEALGVEADDLLGKIEAKNKIENLRTRMSAGQSKTKDLTASQKAKTVVAKELRVTNEHGGFRSKQDFYKNVINFGKGEDVRQFTNEIFTTSSEKGAQMIPVDFVGGINQVMESDQSLLSRTDNYSTSSNRIFLNTDEDQAWDNTAGVRAYWLKEGDAYTESDPELDGAEIKLHKVGALIVATEESLSDMTFLTSLIDRKAPAAIMQKVNEAIISGNGAGKPRGLSECGHRFSTPKESGQAADTFLFENVVAMDSHFMPNANGLWILNPALKEKVRLLEDAAGNNIYLNGSQFGHGAAAPFDTLYGKEVMYAMGGAKELGDEGDAILADLSKYTTVVKTNGVREDVSTHVKWLEDKTAFKYSIRVGGDCIFKEPVTPQYGDYKVSNIITLADRA